MGLLKSGAKSRGRRVVNQILFVALGAFGNRGLSETVRIHIGVSPDPYFDILIPSFMISVLIVLLETTACIGIGLAILRALGLIDRLVPIELAAWSFAFGFGGLGWLLFFFGIFGWLNQLALLALLCAGSAGFYTLRYRRPAAVAQRQAGLQLRWLLIAALVATLAMDLMEVCFSAG